MLEKDDIKEVNEAILSHGMQWPQEAWGRIKRFIEEAQKTSNNKSQPAIACALYSAYLVESGAVQDDGFILWLGRQQQAGA